MNDSAMSNSATSDQAKSIFIDENLVHRMARDVAIYTLTRPLAIVMWCALIAAFGIGVATLSMRAASAPTETGPSAWMVPVILVMMALLVLNAVATARRAIRAATPPGSRTWLSLGEKTMQTGSKRGSSRMEYTTFRKMRVGRNAVILQLSGTNVVTAIPRALLSDAEVALLREKIG